MHKALASLCVLTLAVLASPAHAQAPAPAGAGKTVEAPATTARTPNFFGATGLLYAPSAYVQGDRTITPFINGNRDFVSGGALAGIGNRFEVGVSVLGEQNFGDDTDILANAKFQLLREKKSIPAVAVGVTDAFDQLGVDPSWYVVASKYFTRSEIEQRFALKGTVGFGGGIYNDEPFGGLELFFDRNLSAMAEVTNGDINIGGRYTYKGWAATLGLFDLSHFGGGLAYSLTFK